MHSPRISVDVHFMKKNIYVQKIKRLISLNTQNNITILITLKTQSIIKGISARFYPHAISKTKTHYMYASVLRSDFITISFKTHLICHIYIYIY